MSKIISNAELAEVVKKILDGESGEIDNMDSFESFMTSIAEVVCDYCGGEVRNTASFDGETWYIGIHGNDSLPENGGIWSSYDPEGCLFYEGENAPVLGEKKYATGDWMHIFGVTNQETRCRVVIDLEESKLINAQAWTGLKFEDISCDLANDLEDSLIDANEAHKQPDDFGLETISILPEWAVENVEKANGEADNPVKQGASRLVVLGAHCVDDSYVGPEYCAFRVDDAMISRLISLSELCKTNELSQVNVSIYPECWGPEGIEEEARLQGGDLIVFRNGFFYFNDFPKHSSGCFESETMSIMDLQKLLSSSDEIVVFSNEKLRDIYFKDREFVSN